MAKKLRSGLFCRLFLAIASVVFAFLLVEGVFHIFPRLVPDDVQASLGWVDPAGAESLYSHDEDLEHRMLPGVEVVTGPSECPFRVLTETLPGLPDWGWRSRAYDPGRPLSAFVLGDSFAAGFGVPLEASLAGRLDRRFREHGGQVFNLGLSNVTGGLQHLLIAERALQVVSPERLVVLHSANDHFDNYWFSAWRELHQMADTPGLRFPASRQLYGFLAQPGRSIERMSGISLLGACAVEKAASN